MRKLAIGSLLLVAFAAGMASAIAIACKRIIDDFEDDSFADPFYDDDEGDTFNWGKVVAAANGYDSYAEYAASFDYIDDVAE